MKIEEKINKYLSSMVTEEEASTIASSSPIKVNNAWAEKGKYSFGDFVEDGGATKVKNYIDYGQSITEYRINRDFILDTHGKEKYYKVGDIYKWTVDVSDYGDEEGRDEYYD